MNKIRDTAVHCEAKKHGYRQTQDGVVVSFVLHPQEVPDQLATAALGTRYMLALVEIGDDEQPKEAPSVVQARTSSQAPRSAQDKPGGAHKKSWNELTLAQQAGIRCGEPAFWRFLAENYDQEVTSADEAATFVRVVCGVNSRADLKLGQPSGLMWRQIDSLYSLWWCEPSVVPA